MLSIKIIFLIFFNFSITIATTEWFGDLRASLYKPKNMPYHDLIYDDNECILESNAVPDYVYFGAMIASKYLHDHAQCIHLCQVTPNCVAVNYFRSLESNTKNFCELLNESQFDNPRLMRPFQKGTYYDSIQCKDENSNFKENLDHIDVFEIGKENNRLIIKEYNDENDTKNKADTLISTTTTTAFSHRIKELTSIKKNEQSNLFPSIIPITVPKPLTRTELLKKLAAKVREFNLKFISH